MEPLNTNITRGFRIRNVKAADIGDLIRIGEESNLSSWSANSYLDELKNPDAIMLRLVSDENETAGFVVGRFVIGGEIDIEYYAEIYNIAIRSTIRGKGFGQLLFDAFREKCLLRNASNIWLEVRESNDHAIGFYEKNGFERMQTRSHFYDNPREHAILMKLSLAGSR